MMHRCLLLSFLTTLESVESFAPTTNGLCHHHRPSPESTHRRSSPLSRRHLWNVFGGGSPSGDAATIPATTNARDASAIASCQTAVANPVSPDLPLVELEFPALAALNKLGDGSLRSSIEAEEANLAFVQKLARGLQPPLPLFGGGGKISVAVSASASNAFRTKARGMAQKAGATLVDASSATLEQEVGTGGICIFVTPSSRSDYTTAQALARSGTPRAVVLVNAFAKDPRSVPGGSTMAYFLKPLTYNSQVAGYLIRSYPSAWTVLDATTQQVLGTFADDEILVPNTNTPDLRASGRMVQKSVDERAIAARNNNRNR